MEIRRYWAKAPLLLLLVLILNSKTGAQSVGTKQVFNDYFQKLTATPGKWMSTNSNNVSSDSLPSEKIIYQYQRKNGTDTIELSCFKFKDHQDHPKLFQRLYFAWDDKISTTKIWGTGEVNHVYEGESGKLTPNDISYDLLDPLKKTTVSFLRYNQSVSNNKMKIVFFEQDGAHWRFVSDIDFVAMEP